MTTHISDKTGPAFGEWLITQAHRHDPVGHLATEVAAIGPQVRTWDLSRLRRDLDDHRAAPEAYDALDRAAQEYMFLA